MEAGDRESSSTLLHSEAKKGIVMDSEGAVQMISAQFHSANLRNAAA